MSAPALGDWEFGEQRLVRNHERSSNRLLSQATGRAGLLTYRFVARIGGVSFEAVAVLPPEFASSDLALEYRAERSDGQRLVVKLAGQEIAPELYDWQLIPIARYADSDYAGVISLFGERPDQDRYFYIDYHPAFEDTLLGIRLLHADIMLIDPLEFWAFPKQNGQLVIGPGEQQPNPAEAKLAAERLQELLGENVTQSWVLTDIEAANPIAITEGHLELGVEPYYFFWREANFEAREEIMQQYYTNQLLLLSALANGSTEQIAELQRRLEIIERRAEELFASSDEDPEIEEVESLTAGLRAGRQLLYDLNPAVYEADDNTAGYAALFRLVKQTAPEQWKRFITHMKNANVPMVETPNQWDKEQQ